MLLRLRWQSLWSSGPSPLEKLLEQQRSQRHSTPRWRWNFFTSPWRRRINITAAAAAWSSFRMARHNGSHEILRRKCFQSSFAASTAEHFYPAAELCQCVSEYERSFNEQHRVVVSPLSRESVICRWSWCHRFPLTSKCQSQSARNGVLADWISAFVWRRQHILSACNNCHSQQLWLAAAIVSLYISDGHFFNFLSLQRLCRDFKQLSKRYVHVFC